MSSNNQNEQNRGPGPSPIAGALTYPIRSDNGEPLPMQPRQPRNLQGLLRFAMEATKAEDAPGNSDFGPMDEQRRKFLEDALKSLTIDVVEVLQKAIKVLTDKDRIHSIQLGQPIPDDVKTAFSNILGYIDDMDVANDFYKLGGFSIFPICYGCDNDEIRALASSVLGEVCQNNPFCQARTMECGLVNVLLNLAGSEKGLALTKTLYALSCAARAFEPACRELIAQDGCAILARVLREPEVAARTKAAFLIKYLSSNYPEAKDQFIDNNIVAIIAKQIKQQRDETTEHLLSVLLSLIEGLDGRVLRQCRDPDLQLRSTLEELLKDPDLQNDRFLEEKEYCQEILKQVYENCESTSEEGPER